MSRWMLGAVGLGVLVGGSCRRTAPQTPDLLPPGGAEAVYLYVEERWVGGDSVEVGVIFTSQPWGEGQAVEVDAVTVNGQGVEALSPGLYLFSVAFPASAFPLTFRFGDVETTLSVPVDTLTPPQVVGDIPDTLLPGDTLRMTLSRPAFLVVWDDTGGTVWQGGPADTFSVVFSREGVFQVEVFLWETLLVAEASWGGVGVRAGGKAVVTVRVGEGGGDGYRLLADTTASDCTAAAPCFSWVPADSVEELSVWQVTSQGEVLLWHIIGVRDAQDTTRRIPFGPPVRYGALDPLRYEVLEGPRDTLRPGEHYRVYAVVAGTFVFLGDYRRGQ